MPLERSVVRTLDRPECPLCEAEGSLWIDGLEDHLPGTPGLWSLRRCDASDCGWVWLDPAPVAEDTHLLYQSYFTHEERARSRALRVFDELYRVLNFVPSRLSGLANAKREIDTMYLAGLPRGTLLDVGCGDGRFLARMHDEGWQVRGIDLDERAIERARALHELDVRAVALESAAFAAESFDAVTASHVLEHVWDPIAFVRECLRIVRRRGRVVLTTPNLGSLGFERHRGAWDGLDPPRHLNLFTLETLRRCGELAGASKTQVFATAANAEIFFASSLRFESAARPEGALPAAIRRVKAVAWQYREHAALRSRPELGEEAVLVIEK